MEDIESLIANAQEIITYVAPGFLVVGIFSWIIKHKFSHPTVLVVASIIISTLERMLLDSVKIIDTDINIFGNIINFICTNIYVVCFLSVVVGYGLAIIYKSRIFNNILLCIGIHRTTNESIWDDILENKRWMCVKFHKDDFYHIGQVTNVNNDNDRTCVSLSSHFTAKVHEGQYIPLDNFEPDECFFNIYIDQCEFFRTGEAANFGIKDNSLSKHNWVKKLLCKLNRLNRIKK